ncbi:MAG: hypothetical protein GY793_05140 [Proteobacteria bacterium]|nr:hypothetical protein [Pseudomonadota bacterium]
MKKIILFLVCLSSLGTAYAAGPVGSAIAEPVWVENITVQGDMGWNSSGYSATMGYKDVLLAHYLCRINYSGSRAALYDDFKYIYKDLGTTDKYWLLDPYKQQYSTTDYFLKDGSSRSTGGPSEDFTCNGWSDATGLEGSVFNTVNGKIEVQACNIPTKIPCVTE